MLIIIEGKVSLSCTLNGNNRNTRQAQSVLEKIHFDSNQGLGGTQAVNSVGRYILIFLV